MFRVERQADEQMEEILSMVDLVLSAPPLEGVMLERCKVFLFVTASPPPMRRTRLLPGSKQRSSTERVVGVVVAQPIKIAMRVVRETDGRAVDSGGGVMCE
jgi:N-acetyltransferase